MGCYFLLPNLPKFRAVSIPYEGKAQTLPEETPQAQLGHTADSQHKETD
jgi:hypothetical protein